MTPERVYDLPAKINWHLAVGGRRADGFHELFSLFETIDLCDRLHLEFPVTGAGLSLTTPEGIPNDGRNTIAKADAALRRLLPALPAVIARLEKSIPHAAGLGGGSSDAAGYLLALNGALRLGLTPDRLAAIALEVGSDVPFFLQGGPAVARGRGERLTPLSDAPPVELLLIMPSAASPTADAYRTLNRPAVAELPLPEINLEGDPRAPDFLARCRNDFEAVMPPDVTAPIAAMRALGGRAWLSGSGAASFGWFENGTDLRRAASTLHGQYPRVQIVKTLPRRDYLAQFIFSG